VEPGRSREIEAHALAQTNRLDDRPLTNGAAARTRAGMPGRSREIEAHA